MNWTMHTAVTSALLILALAACGSESEAVSDSGTGSNSGTGSTTETDTGADTDTDACFAEAVADATYSYDFAGWQEYADRNGLRFEGQVPCSLVSVETGEAGLTTVLDCISDAGSFQGEFSIPATDSGTPAWVPSQEVTMRLREEQEGVNYGSLELRGADQSLLFVALNSPTLGSSEFWSVSGALDPISTTVDSEGCGGQAGDRVSVEFSDADASLVLFGGQRGVLPSGANTSLAIELEVADVAEFSANLDFQLLMRRIET